MLVPEIITYHELSMPLLEALMINALQLRSSCGSPANTVTIQQ